MRNRYYYSVGVHCAISLRLQFIEYLNVVGGNYEILF